MISYTYIFALLIPIRCMLLDWYMLYIKLLYFWEDGYKLDDVVIFTTVNEKLPTGYHFYSLI